MGAAAVRLADQPVRNVAAGRQAVAFQGELLGKDIGVGGQDQVAEDLRLGRTPCAAIALHRFAHAPAGHSHLAELDVDGHRDARPGQALGPAAARDHGVELAALVVVDGQTGFGHRAHGRGSRGQVGETPRVGRRGAGLGRSDGFAAVQGQDAAGAETVDLEVGAACARRGAEGRPRVPQPVGQRERHAARHRKAGLAGDGLVGQVPVGGHESLRALAQPPLQAARVEQDAAGKRRVARLRRMPHGGDDIVPSGERDGDAAMDRAVAPRGAGPALGGAVLPQQRMQPVDPARRRARRFEQSGEPGQDGKAP